MSIFTIEEQKTIYKNLLKINQVGKKMAPHSKYILSNGILISYNKQGMSDTEANPVSIGIVDDKLLKGLYSIGNNIGIKINGDDLYKASQEYEFDSLELNEEAECLKINFIYYSINESSFEDNFKDILRSKGYKEEEIEISSALNYTNNMDIYDLFLVYKKNYEPVKEKTIFEVICKFANDKNFMVKKSEEIIDMIDRSVILYQEDEIDRDILDVIISTNQPITMNVKLINNENFRIRIMKSIFSPIASKNSAGFKICKYHDMFILITKINLSGVTLFNIFQVLQF